MIDIDWGMTLENEVKKLFNIRPLWEEVDDYCRAAGLGDMAAVKTYLDKYPSKIDARTTGGMTALIFAAANNQKNVVKLLLENGANADARNDLGWTGKMYAQKHGYADIGAMIEQSLEKKKQKAAKPAP